MLHAIANKELEDLALIAGKYAGRDVSCDHLQSALNIVLAYRNAIGELEKRAYNEGFVEASKLYKHWQKPVAEESAIQASTPDFSKLFRQDTDYGAKE